MHTEDADIVSHRTALHRRPNMDSDLDNQLEHWAAEEEHLEDSYHLQEDK